MSHAQGTLVDRIKKGMTHDPQAKTILAYVNHGKTRRFWTEDGLLYAQGNRIYVLAHGGLQREILKECHDPTWEGHLGVRRTLTLVEKCYYWPHSWENVEFFVKTCLA